jgi:glucokinase
MPLVRRSNAAPRGGIDLGGTKIQAAIVTTGGEVVGDARRPTPTSGGPEDVAAQMAGALVEAADSAGVQTDALGGIGVGSPGDVDEGSGEVASARNLPNWERPFPLARRLSEALGAPVRIANDVDVATSAEFKLGAGKPYASLLGVFWGTGVGGGVVLDGKRWLGRGAAGEIGHMVVVEGGRRCPCGRRGCMEAYAGRAAMEARARRDHADGARTDLFKIMRKRGRDRLTSSIWERALKADDEMAHELIDRAVKALAAGVASAVNLLDVEAVIIGGGLGVRLGEPYVERLRKQMGKHLFRDERPPVIELVALGDFGGAIGASLLFDER